MLPGMAESITVTIADLRAALSRVLDATEARLGPEVSLAVDHYWHLPVEDAFDLANEPQTFTVGQVSDDLDEAVHDDGAGTLRRHGTTCRTSSACFERWSLLRGRNDR